MYLFGTNPASHKHRLEEVPRQVAHLKLPYDFVIKNLHQSAVSIKEKFVDYLEHHDRYPLKQNPQYLSPVIWRTLGQKIVDALVVDSANPRTIL